MDNRWDRLSRVTQGDPTVGDPGLLGPHGPHWVTYLHIWQVAVVAPSCKQTLLSSAQGDLPLCLGDIAL